MGGYWHSECPVCGQGRLVVMDAGAHLFLLCDECESAWLRPEDIDPSSEFDFTSLTFNRASLDSIQRHGWDRYQLVQII